MSLEAIFMEIEESVTHLGWFWTEILVFTKFYNVLYTFITFYSFLHLFIAQTRSQTNPEQFPKSSPKVPKQFQTSSRQVPQTFQNTLPNSFKLVSTMFQTKLKQVSISEGEDYIVPLDETHRSTIYV